MRPVPPGMVRFVAKDVRALDRDGSGAVSKKDVEGATHLVGLDEHGDRVEVPLSHGSQHVGRAARLFAFAAVKAPAHMSLAPPGLVDIPASILRETAPERALLAADSYAPFLRTTKIPDVLDALLAHPDPKLGVFQGGLLGRSFGVVGEHGAREERPGRYDGQTAYLYVAANDPNADALVRAAKDPKYARITVRVVTTEELASRDERLAMRFDRPGMFYVSSQCPVLPQVDDAAYMVPGGRFGLELYYHDARINSVSARSTVEAAVAAGALEEADAALSALRGTANALVNEVLTFKKAMNASMTTSAGRSQAPCLTTVIKQTYAAWTTAHPEQIDDARRWLRWAVGAAEQEYREVWMAPPRFDERTGLSRYVDETPSQAPEEADHFYAGIAWSADDLASDAAVREHGWDSMPAALLTSGPDQGKPRMHELLPVCLQCLLYTYERDLADLTRALDDNTEHAGGLTDPKLWDAAADKRRDTMNTLMWNERAGCYRDLVRGTGEQNGAEDLRSLMPLWAGVVDGDTKRQKRMHARVREYVRPGGLATSTRAAWRALLKLNPDYVSRCQWGHKDIGWPIATYETVVGLRRTGASALADEVSYRWCLAVQAEMDTHGGLHPDSRGGYTAPVFEKMNVTQGVHDGAAEVGYGNQGAGDEGRRGGFRWGLDAYKLLFRELPPTLQTALKMGRDPDAVFDARLLK